MDDATSLIVALLGAGGGGAVLLAAVRGFINWLSGAAGRERDKNTDLISQRKMAILDRDAAEKERDDSDKKRRSSDEYSATLRRQLIENGFDPKPWPQDHTFRPQGEE